MNLDLLTGNTQNRMILDLEHTEYHIIAHDFSTVYDCAGPILNSSKAVFNLNEYTNVIN